MQIFTQTLYIQHLHLFLDGSFWMDLSVICILVLLVYIYIIYRSREITEKNTIHNDNLLKFRTEVYQYYEKNFFI